MFHEKKRRKIFRVEASSRQKRRGLLWFSFNAQILQLFKQERGTSTLMSLTMSQLEAKESGGVPSS
jgi:hypothetical protein